MKYKDHELNFYTIKIKVVRSVEGNKTSKIYKDKMYCVECKDYVGSGFGFCQPTFKKAFKQLKELLHI